MPLQVKIYKKIYPHTCFDRLQLFAKWYIINLIYLHQRILPLGRCGFQVFFPFAVVLTVPKSMTIPCGESVLFLMECELWITFRLQKLQKNGESQGAEYKCFAHKEESKGLSV